MQWIRKIRFIPSVPVHPVLKRDAVLQVKKDGFLYNNGLLVSAKEEVPMGLFKVAGQIYLVNENGKGADRGKEVFF